jgi:prepilin-type N-terminal cleavage/methylation domain-containing protein
MMRSPRRSGFTLLEVLLASLIATLLLAALYFAMDVTLRQTQESRDSVDVENLARGVHTRMALDLSASLGPMPPKSGGNAAGQQSNSSDPSSTPSTSDPSMMATGSTPMAGASGTTPTAGATTPIDPTMVTVDPTMAQATSAEPAADIAFQAGIIGTADQLTVFASRLPKSLISAKGLTEDSATQEPSDLVRITYWMGSNGLCRQERPWVTADGVRNSSDPDTSTEASDTLVHEVTSVSFEYFDPRQNRGWVSEWDGSQMSDDGVTPLGPPRAVKVTLVFSVPSTRQGGAPYEHTVVQVIPVRSAAGGFTPPMITPSTDPGTTSSDPSSTGNSSNSSSMNGSSSPMNGSTPTNGGSTPMSGGTKSGGTSTPSTTTPSSGGTKTGGTSTPSTTTPSSGGTKTGGTTAPSSGGTTSGGTRGGGK